MANAAGDSVVLAPRIKLLVTEGPCAGQVLEPKASLACLSIGRTRASKLHVKDPSVSERHGEVSWSGKAWVLKDLGSSNGTVVNGRRLVPELDAVELMQGDELKLGSDTSATVQLDEQDWSQCTVERLLHMQLEVLVHQVESLSRSEAQALLRTWAAVLKDAA